MKLSNGRLVVVDIATTGGSIENDRIIEIGCIELMKTKETGNTFHTYLNPEKAKISYSSYLDHGITKNWLDGEPAFKDIVEDLLGFLQLNELLLYDSPTRNFLNAELKRLNYPEIPNESSNIQPMILIDLRPRSARIVLTRTCKNIGIPIDDPGMRGALANAYMMADLYKNFRGE